MTFNLCKANIRRLLRNRIFIIGAILIFFISFWYISRGETFLLTTDSAQERAILINALIPGFFTIFYGLFTAPELGDGVIRNKLSVGCRQSSVYLSFAATAFTSVLILTFVWLAAALAAGTTVTSSFAAFIPVSVFSSTAYACLIHIFCMRIRKSVIAMALSIVTLQTLASVLLFINSFYSLYGQEAFRVILNIMPLGQWLASTPIAGEGAGLSPLHMITISLVSAAVYIFAGSLGINRREIK